MLSIKQMRKQHHLTQAQFAELLGVSQPTIVNWESSTAYPPAVYLPQIATILQCRIDDLYDRATTDSA